LLVTKYKVGESGRFFDAKTSLATEFHQHVKFLSNFAAKNCTAAIKNGFES